MIHKIECSSVVHNAGLFSFMKKCELVQSCSAYAKCVLFQCKDEDLEEIKKLALPVSGNAFINYGTATHEEELFFYKFQYFNKG